MSCYAPCPATAPSTCSAYASSPQQWSRHPVCSSRPDQGYGGRGVSCDTLRWIFLTLANLNTGHDKAQRLRGSERGAGVVSYRMHAQLVEPLSSSCSDSTAALAASLR